MDTGKDEITTLKTSAACRKIPMVEQLHNTLVEFKELSKEFYAGEYLFFGDSTISPSSISRATKKYMELAKVKKIRIHDFRHSFASMCIQLGANPNTLATVMGHSSVKETLDTYAEMYPNEDVKIAKKISTLF